MPRNGFGGAITGKPAWASPVATSYQPEASANAPCTSTTVGSDRWCAGAAGSASTAPVAAAVVPASKVRRVILIFVSSGSSAAVCG
ncbi:hypothetical protein GCM10010112_66260 [Actinoplanes lobatus]|uniref:Uncharacterized protein n=1 Tax=Actinoplanes lobatus TaxID=113568 RepID=A0ABQ4AUB4_9ACTN|nr:hypothetical protein GCM10010112_66260 [Actinoplanes lobatus]GIE44375.1 hypothetical protein Alo02nite_72730 [Actinoplanes lobatus]